MTFAEWINRERISYAEAARRIGAANATVARRYALHINRPRPAAMERVHAATDGLVTPNDWFGLPGPQPEGAE